MFFASCFGEQVVTKMSNWNEALQMSWDWSLFSNCNIYFQRAEMALSYFPISLEEVKLESKEKHAEIEMKNWRETRVKIWGRIHISHDFCLFFSGIISSRRKKYERKRHKVHPEVMLRHNKSLLTLTLLRLSARRSPSKNEAFCDSLHLDFFH